MKPVDPKDKQKLTILIALGVATVAGVGYEMFTMLGPAPAPAKPAEPVKEEKKTDTASKNQTVDGVDTAQITVAGPPVGGRDPFMPMGSVAPVSKTAPVTPVAPPTPTPVLGGSRGSLTQLLALAEKRASENRLLANASTRNALTSVVLPAAPPPPPISVMGVVLGEPGVDDNVAIIRGSGAAKGDERRFVTLGDYVGNGYRVVALHADGIDIEEKTGHRRVTVRIGKTGEESRATQ